METQPGNGLIYKSDMDDYDERGLSNIISLNSPRAASSRGESIEKKFGAPTLKGSMRSSKGAPSNKYAVTSGDNSMRYSDKIEGANSMPKMLSNNATYGNNTLNSIRESNTSRGASSMKRNE